MVFVLTAFLCIWLGLRVNQVKQQKKAVAWVEQVGGEVMYDYEFDDFDQQFLNPAPELPGPIWLRELIGVDFFATVVTVDLADAEIDDLSHLVALHNLKLLFLERTRVSDFSSVAKLTSLQILMLREMQVTDLSVLTNLANLRELWLESTPVSDLSPLTSLTQLKDLIMLDVPIAEEEIENLKEALPKCSISGP